MLRQSTIFGKTLTVKTGYDKYMADKKFKTRLDGTLVRAEATPKFEQYYTQEVMVFCRLLTATGKDTFDCINIPIKYLDENCNG